MLIGVLGNASPYSPADPVQSLNSRLHTSDISPAISSGLYFSNAIVRNQVRPLASVERVGTDFPFQNVGRVEITRKRSEAPRTVANKATFEGSATSRGVTSEGRGAKRRVAGEGHGGPSPRRSRKTTNNTKSRRQAEGRGKTTKPRRRRRRKNRRTQPRRKGPGVVPKMR